MRSSRPRLNLRILTNEPGEEGLPLVLIEGDKTTLEWFGNLILDHARDPQDCGLQYDAGVRVFSRRNELGFYIHRLPCQHEETKRRSAKKRTLGKSQAS